MEYSLLKKAITLSETVFEGSCEQPIDLDFNLPDYCPDILKILKCQVYPKVYTRNISGDRLDVDGCAIVKIMYVESIKKAVRCSEQTVPFSCSFNLKTTPQNAVVLTTVKPEYLNCRALSPRRLDIHGAFTVNAKVICKTDNEIAYCIEDKDAQIKKEKCAVSTVVGCTQQLFSVTEDIEIKENQAPVEAVLRSDASAVVSDYKIISNKIMAKGEVTLKLLYLSNLDTGNIDVLEYTIPISQIIDVDGVDENSKATIKLDLLNYDVKVRNDLADNNIIISFESKLCLTAEIYAEEEVEIITDAYSTKYDMDLIYSQKTLAYLNTIVSDNCISKNSIELSSSGILKVLDLWSEQCVCKTLIENGQIVVAGKVNICILATDQEQNPFYTERTLDFTYPVTVNGDLSNLVVQANAKVVSISYRLNGANNMEVRLDVKINAFVFENKQIRVVTNASANEEHLRIKDKNIALTLYYTDENEQIWNIARNYCVSSENIKIENDLTEETVPSGKMILIPNI